MFFYKSENLAYKFQFSNCNITYYSKTERHLKVDEHLSKAGEHVCPHQKKKGQEQQICR